MGIRCHGDKSFGGDVVWKQCVQPVQELVFSHRKYRRFMVEMGKKLRGMYTGIRTSAPYRGRWLAQQRSQCPVKQLLHGYRVGLDLPTVVGATIKGDFDEISLM